MRSLIPNYSPPTEPWTPKSVDDFLAQVSMMGSVSEKISALYDYVNRLQEEMKKIDVFKRELPLCMILFSDAIARIKKEIMQCKINLVSKPVLEEFIPLKKSSSSDEREEKSDDVTETSIVDMSEKMDWMSSVQLGSLSGNCEEIRKEQADDRPAKRQLFPSGKIREAGKAFSSSKGSAFSPYKGRSAFPPYKGSAFSPYKGSSNFLATTAGRESRNELTAVTSLSLRTPEINSSTEEIFRNVFKYSSSSRSGSSCGTNSQSSFKADSQYSGKKQRRCWSQELQLHFASVLEKLGGAQAATPKQIRELMQVDGLTNDEVKSHLQKYRLHLRQARRAAADAGNSHSSSPQGPLRTSRGTSGTSVTGGEDGDESERER